MLDAKSWQYFYEIFEAIPRQGPGLRESTLQALRMVPPVTRAGRILDIGCGSGAQTIDLARATDATIVGVDNHPAFVAQLCERANAAGLGERVSALVADMSDLPFPDGSFDLLWSEGAIFIIGFSQGLARWRRLLRPGGHLVVSEYCWFRGDAPDDLRKVHTEGCSDVGSPEDRRRALAASGNRLVRDFLLPDAGWWENYYVPLAEALSAFRRSHAGAPEALEVAAGLQHEIDLSRKYKAWFGYVFFVMQKVDR